jgi:diacylglycerol kinase family enzyme
VINRLERAKGVTILRAKELSLRAGKKQIYIQTDGELLGALPATVSVVPRALNLLLPAKYLRQNG